MPILPVIPSRSRLDYMQRSLPVDWVMNEQSIQAYGLQYWWPAITTPSQKPWQSAHRLTRARTLAITAASWTWDYKLKRPMLLFNAGTEQAAATLDVTMSVFTVSLWCVRNTFATDNALVSSNSSVTGDLTLEEGAAANLRWWIFNVGAGPTTPSNTFLSDTLYHVVGTYSSVTTVIEIYINGVQQSTSTTSSRHLNADFVLGNGTGFTRFNGNLGGDVRIYNRVLSAAEIAALYDERTRWDLYRPRRRVFFPPTTSAASVTTVQRRTLSPLGTRGGARQQRRFLA